MDVALYLLSTFIHFQIISLKIGKLKDWIIMGEYCLLNHTLDKNLSFPMRNKKYFMLLIFFSWLQ